MKLNFKKIVAIFALLALAACGQPTVPVGVKLGKPYEVNGKTYYPAPDNYYDETGEGSWYGPGFHGKRTASGERFNENDITAAHPTLPMPSLVRVTNLENNEDVIVRINDRGPFHSNRIIDLSKKSAQLIDLKSTKPVRVQYLKKETDDFMAAFKAGDTSKMDMAEINRKDKEGPKYETQITENNVQNDDPENIRVEAVDSSPVQSIQTSDLAAPTVGAKGEKNIMPLKPVENSASTKISAAKQDSGVLKLPERTISKTVEKTIPDSKVSAQVNSGKYFVLAGSFSVEENAKKLAKKVAEAGKVNIEKIVVNGKNLWRVVLLGFNDKAKAQKALELIHKAGVSDARILSK